MTAARFLLDGRAVPFEPGDTILQAAERAGCWIPHLCWHPDFPPHGSCRLCTVHVGGRPAAACSTPAGAGLVIENRSAALDAYRRALLQMLFVGGEHFCPGCEVSGNCLLQATAYALGMEGPRFPAVHTHRPLDGSHPDILLDPNRCILCELCVRASRDVDGKHVFAIGGHGADAHLLVNAASGRLGDTAFDLRDRAAGICPVGAILPKRRGFATPIGERRFDAVPIDADARAGGGDGDGAPADGGRA